MENKIRIMHAADLHGDFDALAAYAKAVQNSQPDIAFIGGDLIEGVFTDEELQDYSEVFNDYHQTRLNLLTIVSEEFKINQDLIKNLFPPSLFHALKDDLLEEGTLIETLSGDNDNGDNKPTTRDLYKILENPLVPINIGNAVQAYLKIRESMSKYVEIGRKSMEHQYSEIKNVLEDSSILVIPGNQDGKCLEDVLNNFSLHKKVIDIKGLKFAGYGGASGIPQWIPTELLEIFEYFVIQQETGESAPISEATRFFINNPADIFLTHECPVKDEGLSRFIQEKQPSLMLAGHIHEMVGLFKVGRSYLIQPGKLGATDMSHEVNLRTFTSVTIIRQDNSDPHLNIHSVDYSYLDDKNEVQPLMNYSFDSKGNFKSKNVFDPKIFNVLDGQL